MRVERQRQDLNNRKNFDIKKAFEAISAAVKDDDGKDEMMTITKNDISSFLIRYHYTPSQQQVDLLYQRLDRYKIDSPKLDDFKAEMLPRTSVTV